MNFERAHYSHGTIRKLVVAFGTVFNGIKIFRKDDGPSGKVYSVPIGYGAKSHWYYRMEDGPENQSSLPVPRMGFVYSGGGYDSPRALNRLNKLQFDEVVEDEAGGKVRSVSLNQVPWKFNFDMTVYSKNMEDALQISEQFLPFFSPTVNLKILEIPELDHWSDIEIALASSPTLTDSFEEGFSNRRVITMDFSFEVSGWLYPPVKKQKVITKVISDIDNPLTDYRYDLETITVQANPGELSNKNNSSVTIEIDV